MTLPKEHYLGNLEHLKQYIEETIGNTFDGINIVLDLEEHEQYLLERYKDLVHDIHHAIDHIIIDNTDSNE